MVRCCPFRFGSAGGLNIFCARWDTGRARRFEIFLCSPALFDDLEGCPRYTGWPVFAGRDFNFIADRWCRKALMTRCDPRRPPTPVQGVANHARDWILVPEDLDFGAECRMTYVRRITTRFRDGSGTRADVWPSLATPMGYGRRGGSVNSQQFVEWQKSCNTRLLPHKTMGRSNRIAATQGA